jgi:hypothetical protein
MAQGQAELEMAWEELTWRAREAGSVIHRRREISDTQWRRVQEFVDALNEFGTDPSGYMDMGRDMANAEKQRQCEEFATIMEEWKEKVLSDLREDDEWVNLQESTCVDGLGADTFGDTCAWYASNQSGCGNYDHPEFTAAVECCACGGGYAPVPEWNINLDYDAADQYSAELSVAYQDYQRRVADVLTRWKAERDALDAQFWNDEFIQEAAIGEKLDEKTMRSLVTWIADGTEIKG